MPLPKLLTPAVAPRRPSPLRLPARMPGRAWAVTLLGFLAAYGLMFVVVHPYIDTRICVARLPDPLYRLIPFDRRWYFVSHEIYYVANLTGVLSFAYLALRGDHRPFLRFGLGLALMSFLRSITMVLLPLCRANVLPGTAALHVVPMLDLGFVRIPYLLWAENDLVFSGHVGEFLLMYWAASRYWPRPLLLLQIAFQLAQAYALLATRGHYTIDVVVAIPCTFLADRLGLALLGRLAPRVRGAVVEAASEPGRPEPAARASA